MPIRTKKRARKLNESSGSGRIHGLRNLGNTCFFNCVLQCLGQTPYFLEILKKNLSLLENSFTRTLHDTLEELQTFSGKFELRTFIAVEKIFPLILDGASRPINLLTQLTNKWPQFAGGDQHDSHELLHRLLEVVRSESLSNKRLQDRLNNNISNPEQVFGGFLITTSVCQDCQLITSHFDDFLDISVPINVEKSAKPRRISLNVSFNLSNSRLYSVKRPQRRAKKMAEEAINNLYKEDTSDISIDHDNSDLYIEISPVRKKRKKLTISSKSESINQEISLESCLRNFTARELMSDNNKVHCNACSQENDGADIQTSVTKQSLIAGPPAVLILHLNRFKFTGYSVRKINKHISFPLTIDIAQYCGSIVETLPHILSNQKKILYSLYGIIEHSGGINRKPFPFSYFKLISTESYLF